MSNIQTQLRQMANHTGLDAIAELMYEAADEIDQLVARYDEVLATLDILHYDLAGARTNAQLITERLDWAYQRLQSVQPAQAQANQRELLP